MTIRPKRLLLAYALVQYRSGPVGRRSRPINLGALMEFAVNNTWAVGLAMRHDVDRAALESLSALSRTLIETRMDIMRGEVEAALGVAQRPGDVLRILSERNPWSFHVAPPQPMSVPARDAAAAPSVEGLAEKHVLLAFSRAILPAHATQGGRAARPAQARPTADISKEIPPAWMVPTIFWRLPIGDRG
jgi:hypothetical protein